MRNTNEQSLGSVIKQILKTQKLESKLTEVRIKDAWNRLMGETIAMRTTDIKISGKTIIIFINSAPLKQELTFGKNKIMKLLNDDLGAIMIEEVVIQ